MTSDGSTILSLFKIGDVVRYGSRHGNMRVGRIESVQANTSGDATHYKIREDGQPLAEYIPASHVMERYIDHRICECGADKVKSPYHARYCPKTTEKP